MPGAPSNILPICVILLSIACGHGCAVSSVPVRFTSLKAPTLDMATGRTIGVLGFNGEDRILTDRVAFLLNRRLQADTTLTMIESREIMRVLSRHADITGYITDSLAVKVGRHADADLILTGDLERMYSEQYGEEKKYRMEEAFTPSGLRLIDVPYYEPFIDQIAGLSAALRVLETSSGRLVNRTSAAAADTFRVILPTRIKNPPEGVIPVERVTPLLLNRVISDLIDRLISSFAWHEVIVTREIFSAIKPDQADITALREGDWEQARLLWEQAVQDNPEDAAAWNNLGVAYEQARRPHAARQAYTRALELSPGNKTIIRNSKGVDK